MTVVVESSGAIPLRSVAVLMDAWTEPDPLLIRSVSSTRPRCLSDAFLREDSAVLGKLRSAELLRVPEFSRTEGHGYSRRA